MLRLGRRLGRGLAPPRFQGIRFRLGMAMAIALLPILILGAVQAQSDFRKQESDRRADLQLAASRAAVATKARLDGATVLLEAIGPESSGPYCGARLASLAQRLRDYESLFRYSATGHLICASRPAAASATPEVIRARPWFGRLAAGEHVAVVRSTSPVLREPALVVATRVDRPMGRFDGGMTALIPLRTLQPDIADPALPEGAQAALTDAEGRILAATDIQAFTLAGRQGLTGWVERARADASSLFEAEDADGQRRVYAGAALAGQDVYVLLSAPAPGLLSWARLNPIGSLLLPLAAWLTAFGAVMLVSERVVVRWLDYLERIAAIYARGRFSVRPVQAMHAPSEIRILARTLDDLAENIVSRDRSLLDSLSEKDALMREIHHRVKNNLQIISSLLSMQQRALTDAAAKSALGDTRQRISALALIYRTLYQSHDVRVADSRTFLTELVGQLVAADAMRGYVVTSSVEADSIPIDPDKLAPLALWLVEAITNAQKHAFAGRGGDLQVRFRVDGEQSVLEVQDDGPGQPTTDGAPGVGQTLMTAFARQLRGDVEILAAPGGGVLARMTFLTPEAATPIDPADVVGTVRA